MSLQDYEFCRTSNLSLADFADGLNISRSAINQGFKSSYHWIENFKH